MKRSASVIDIILNTIFVIVYFTIIVSLSITVFRHKKVDEQAKPEAAVAAEKVQSKYRVDVISADSLFFNKEEAIQKFFNDHPTYEIVSLFQGSGQATANVYVISKVK